jgi:hypothetical protein
MLVMTARSRADWDRGHSIELASRSAAEAERILQDRFGVPGTGFRRSHRMGALVRQTIEIPAEHYLI